METKIDNYLREEKQIDSELVREMLIKKITKYDDILQEFMQWLEARNYEHAQVVVDDYNAQKIYELAPQLDGMGVYNFLVTLRDEPQEAQAIIDEGFIAK